MYLHTGKGGKRREGSMEEWKGIGGITKPGKHSREMSEHFVVTVTDRPYPSHRYTHLPIYTWWC